MFDSLLNISLFFITEANIVQTEAEPIGSKNILKQVISFLKGNDSFIKIDMMHLKVALEMIEIRMLYGTSWDNLWYVVQGIIVLT